MITRTIHTIREDFDTSSCNGLHIPREWFNSLGTFKTQFRSQCGNVVSKTLENSLVTSNSLETRTKVAISCAGCSGDATVQQLSINGVKLSMNKP